MDMDSAQLKEKPEEKKESHYSLEEAINVKVLQELQDKYAKLTGLSIWLLDEDDVRVTERSISHSFLKENEEEIIPIIDELLVKKDGRISYEYKNKIILIDSFFILSKASVMGKCVLLNLVSELSSENEQSLQACSAFFSQALHEMLKSQLRFLRSNDKLQQMMENEKYVEAENQRLQKENDFDMLTKIHSRAYFYRCLEEINAREDLLPVSLVVGDVNSLKFTNDMFGHRHGDWLLQVVAKVMQEEAADNYVVARCGGDEFFALLPQSNRAAANYYCYRITERLKLESSCCLMPTVSLGAAKKSEMSQDLHRLMEIADAKMYSAKGEYKKHQDYFEEMMQVLYARGFVTPSMVEKRIETISEFAEYLEWPEDKKSQAALLIRYQDIGLCIVPQRIYFKKEEHTEKEWREIKKHPQIGAKLTLIRPDTVKISELIKQTHENWDGSGWPRAISDKQVDMRVYAVRIVTDYLDYKEKKGKQSAIAYMREHAGTIYEPEMVKQFLQFTERKTQNKI